MASVREPRIPQGERLAVTVLLAVSVHALLILGLTFEWPEPKQPEVTTMEVTLVPQQDAPPPEEAHYLAQANQEGAGNPEASRERPQEAAAPPPPSATEAAAEPESSPAEEQAAPETLTAPVPEAPAPEAAEQNPASAPEQAPLPPARELLDRSREIAKLSAEVLERQDAYDQRLRRAYVSASTREYLYASYEEAWRSKVERLGNQYYPAEARRRNLSGRLIMEVGINPDGSLYGIEIVESSGHAVLDDAAVQIVRRGAPYAPFSPEMREKIDVLHIIRIWEFRADERMSTRR
ncbi:energy transducer TonB [Ectothiorhodospiraceae bacterium 2226]|nr:energy transducer TonB [Ectothiorhodospiraceae bacterium 2226]